MNDGSGDELAYVEFSVDLAEVEEISPIPVEPEANLESATNDGLYAVDKMMSDFDPEFTNDIENLLSNPNQSLDEARAAADEMAEEKIRDLPFLFQSPAGECGQVMQIQSSQRYWKIYLLQRMWQRPLL